MESAVSSLRTSGTPVSVIGEGFRQITGRILVMVCLHSPVKSLVLDLLEKSVGEGKRHEAVLTPGL